MTIHNIELPIFKYNNIEHKKIKNQILEKIAEIGIFSFNKGNNKISNTDYFLDKSYSDRSYIEPILPFIDLSTKEMFFFYKDMLDILEDNSFLTFDITGVWYQQYYPGDVHELHIHPKCMFSCVYYVELPIVESQTQFSLSGKTIKLDVQEGDLIIFPSIIPHKSPMYIGSSSERKTVISFNGDIQEFNTTKENKNA